MNGTSIRAQRKAKLLQSYRGEETITFESQLRNSTTVSKLAPATTIQNQTFTGDEPRYSTSQLPPPTLNVTTPSHAYMQPTFSAQLKNQDTIGSKRWSTSKKSIIRFK